MNVYSLQSNNGGNEPDAVEQLFDAYYKRLPKPIKELHTESVAILQFAKQNREGYFFIIKNLTKTLHRTHSLQWLLHYSWNWTVELREGILDAICMVSNPWWFSHGFLLGILERVSWRIEMFDRRSSITKQLISSTSKVIEFKGSEDAERKNYLEFSLIKDWLLKSVVCAGIPLIGVKWGPQWISKQYSSESGLSKAAQLFGLALIFLQGSYSAMRLKKKVKTAMDPVSTYVKPETRQFISSAILPNLPLYIKPSTMDRAYALYPLLMGIVSVYRHFWVMFRLIPSHQKYWMIGLGLSSLFILKSRA